MERIDESLLGITEQKALAGNYKAYIRDTVTGKCYVIPYGEWAIGRKDDKIIDIPVETKDVYMSRIHAVITLEKNIIGENSLYIRDTVERRNPTEADNYKIGNYFDTQLYDGSTFQMGETNFTVHLKPLA